MKNVNITKAESKGIVAAYLLTVAEEK